MRGASVGASRQVEFREVTRTACSHDRGFECCFGLGEMSHLYTGVPLKCESFEKKQTPVILDRKKEKETKMLEWHDNQENSQQRYYRAFFAAIFDNEY